MTNQLENPILIPGGLTAENAMIGAYLVTRGGIRTSRTQLLDINGKAM
jgi:hypothetical protein